MINANDWSSSRALPQQYTFHTEIQIQTQTQIHYTPTPAKAQEQLKINANHWKLPRLGLIEHILENVKAIVLLSTLLASHTVYIT